MWQVENENMIHLKNFPDGWFVICLDNPDEAEYSIDIIDDAAGLRRKSQIFVEHSNKEFITYARENKFYPDVISYFETHPDRIYDVQSLKNKMVYTNPASIEKFSQHCWKYDPTGTGKGIRENLTNLRIIAESLFNRSAGGLIIDFLEDSTDIITPEDIIYRKHTKEINEKFNSMVQSRNPKLSDLMSMFFNYLVSTKPKLEKKEEKNIVDFLSENPIDVATIFLTEIETLDKLSDEFEYMIKLHMELHNNYEKYVDNFYNKLLNVKKEEIDDDDEEDTE
jgi:hypothetical protein